MPPTASFTRRRFLSSTGLFVLIASVPGARAAEHSGTLPWKPFAALPPEPLPGGRWYVLTPDEARTVEAIVDRLIPADELSIGGKDAGCASFIDRQLAGSYGMSDRLYTQGPFAAGLPTQGYQGAEAPAARYKAGLAALNKHTQARFAGKSFFDLAAAEQDQVLRDFEAGKVEYKSAAGFFNLVLQNTMEGFFADPIYGGNKDMAGWKFIGFPGARYDYRDYITAHNKPFSLPPLSIAGRPEWKTGDKTSGN
ncbi:gluconate 2-dehydrogenase subunit 3 family protein [uncultured Bosea sp.]|uniref:gluconate 2-dehydrogenase subunit 3 family protein n=1 Tax=uncultured Bosea sp. TaxID=211457 RepID=UPI0025E6E52C|nr:gluconate 2-dehydrogenase subunit 3 family protein [uncultured Bosea sp.]